MENFASFWNKYKGAIIGLIVGIILSVLLLYTNFYKVIIAIMLILGCMWFGNYFQLNKENVKDKIKNIIDRI